MIFILCLNVLIILVIEEDEISYSHKIILLFYQSMEPHQQLVIQDLLTLLKQRTKEHPNPNVGFEEVILKSSHKQDYLDLVNRLSLKSQSQDTLVELIGYARSSGRYGIPVYHLEDLNKSWE